jgi:hypothetical protein
MRCDHDLDVHLVDDDDCLACGYERGDSIQPYDDHTCRLAGCVLCFPTAANDRRLADFRKATLYALGCQGYDGAPSSGFPDHERARDIDDAYPRQALVEDHQCTVGCYVVNDRPDLEAVPPVAPAEWFGEVVTLEGSTTSYLRPEITRSPRWLRAYMSGSYPVMRDATTGEILGGIDSDELIDTAEGLDR